MIYYYAHQQLRQYDKYNIKVLQPPTKEQIDLDDARDHLRIIPFGSPPEHEEDTWITNNIVAAREWCEGWSMCALARQQLQLGIALFPNTFPYFNMPMSSRPGWFIEDVWRNNGIMLPMASPLVSVDEVAYDDSGGNTVVLDPSAYYANDFEHPAVLYPAPGTVWPIAQSMNRRAVRVKYTAGYQVTDDTVSPQTVSNLPFSLRAAMMLVLGHLHENRENSSEVTVEEIPLGAKALMERYRTRLGIA